MKKSIKKIKINIFIRILCVIVFMMFIFYLSSQDGFQSDQISRGVLEILHIWKLPFLSSTDNALSDIGGIRSPYSKSTP